jgi:hypothetical protein
MIDNEIYAPKVRTAKFLSEIRQGKMGMVNKNAQIIQEKGASNYIIQGFRIGEAKNVLNKAGNRTISMREIRAPYYMESYLKIETNSSPSKELCFSYPQLNHG